MLTKTCNIPCQSTSVRVTQEGRRETGNLGPFACGWVWETEEPVVQKVAEVGRECPTVSRRNTSPRVKRITYQGKSGRRKVNTDLMRTACSDLDLQK